MVTGSALIIGALIGLYFNLPQRLVAGIMAFGSGVLISMLTFNLLVDAYDKAGIYPVMTGFLSGAIAFSLGDITLSRYSARHRKRSTGQLPSEEAVKGSGLAIALGSLMDGIPEAIVIGISLLAGGGVSTIIVIGIFLSNFPEGLSSSAGMRLSGRSKAYVLGVWGTIAALTAIAAIVGCIAFEHLPGPMIAGSLSFAAGALLAMVADTMIPEAFEKMHDFTGLIVVAGFALIFFLDRIL